MSPLLAVRSSGAAPVRWHDLVLNGLHHRALRSGLRIATASIQLLRPESIATLEQKTEWTSPASVDTGD